MSGTIATATEPNRSVSALVRLPTTVPVPAQARRAPALAADPGDAVFHELGEERIEVIEVPVQYALGHPGLGGDRAAGQGARPIPEQDALGGVEQLLPRVPQGYPGRHRPSFLRCGRN